MAVDINTLLNLPQKQRREIAEKLWKSLSPNTGLSKEEAATITLLEKRWQDIQAQKATLLSPNDLRAKIQEHRSKK